MEKASPFSSETVDRLRKSSEAGPTLRFKLSLTDSDDKRCPEFSFQDLVKTASVSEVQAFQGSCPEPRQFYQGDISMHCRFLSLWKHDSDFWFAGIFFLSRVVQGHSGENSTVGRRWRRRKSQSFGQEVWGKIRKLSTSVSRKRFFVQRFRFLRNRTSIEAMRWEARTCVQVVFWTADLNSLFILFIGA